MTDDVEKALEGAEAEDTVVVHISVPTGITLNGLPHPTLGMVSSWHEVTLSGLMEVQAILERGGLVEQGNVVNEAEAAVLGVLDQAGDCIHAGHSRDIVAVLAERGLLRKGA